MSGRTEGEWKGLGSEALSENDAKCRPRSQSNKRNVNHKRQGSAITRIGCTGDLAQV
jgi:hypothetical protein